MSNLKSRIVRLEGVAGHDEVYCWLEGEQDPDGKIATAVFCWADQNPELEGSEPAVIPKRMRIL